MAEKQEFSEKIQVTGKAELANEQKLRFLQSGKVQEIYVTVGDSVEKNAVLASLDKREFFQEMKQLDERIAQTQKNIKEEQDKATGIEARKMKRDIESAERKLKESEDELAKMLQNASLKAEEKKLDLNAKRRELETQKNKYELDKNAYNKEWENRETLAKSRIENSKKNIVTIIQ